MIFYGLGNLSFHTGHGGRQHGDWLGMLVRAACGRNGIEDVAVRFPADHYVLIDDKVRILAAIKQAWGKRVTTIFPRQGHYALDVKEVAKYPAPDLKVERIEQLLDLAPAAMVDAAR